MYAVRAPSSRTFINNPDNIKVIIINLAAISQNKQTCAQNFLYLQGLIFFT